MAVTPTFEIRVYQPIVNKKVQKLALGRVTATIESSVAMHSGSHTDGVALKRIDRDKLESYPTQREYKRFNTDVDNSETFVSR